MTPPLARLRMLVPWCATAALALGVGGSGCAREREALIPPVGHDVAALAGEAGIDADVLDAAMRARTCALENGALNPKRADLLTVIDYSLPSTERRLWVLDLDAGEVRFHERVAHGKHTGANRAREFSNESGSLKSSLGVFRTDETYEGKHGYSLRLDGLEPGINDNARDRAIVIHAAHYATAEFAAAHGRLGRSWGCPALDPEVSADVIDAIHGGTLLVAYYPDPDWLDGSRFLACGGD